MSRLLHLRVPDEADSALGAMGYRSSSLAAQAVLLRLLSGARIEADLAPLLAELAIAVTRLGRRLAHLEEIAEATLLSASPDPEAAQRWLDSLPDPGDESNSGREGGAA